MIEGSGEIVINCTPETACGFVLDMDRYRLADPKIGRVFWEDWDGDRGRMKFSGKLRGIPTPPLTVNVRREGLGRIDIYADTSTLIGWLTRFHGSFDLTAQGPGCCLVAHVERFDFRRPLRWIADPLFRKWLAADTPTEMWRLKAMIEQ